jgi:acetyltransferase-like isoleucine patch superfamily enzyme
VITSDVKLGKDVIVYHPELVNLYGCEIGDGTKIAAFVEIGRNVRVGRNCKIEAFAFIPEGVAIGDGVFVGPHACFTNDKYPRASSEGGVQNQGEWELVKTIVEDGASIGANATILCGVTLGKGCLVAAGSVVTKDVPPNKLVMGRPAKVVRDAQKDIPRQ